MINAYKPEQKALLCVVSSSINRRLRDARSSSCKAEAPSLAAGGGPWVPTSAGRPPLPETHAPAAAAAATANGAAANVAAANKAAAATGAAAAAAANGAAASGAAANGAAVAATAT